MVLMELPMGTADAAGAAATSVGAIADAGSSRHSAGAGAVGGGDGGGARAVAILTECIQKASTAFGYASPRPHPARLAEGPPLRTGVEVW